MECETCGAKLKCMAGCSAHRSNWYCPECDKEDNKMKFNPKTHQTRCGAPWRNLEVRGQSNIIAVSSYNEIVCRVDPYGKVFYFDTGKACPDYDLIPIRYEHNLPKGLDPKWKYAAKNKDGALVYTNEPDYSQFSGYFASCGEAYRVSNLFPQALKNVPCDAGYFKRIDDTDDWEFVRRVE